MTSVWADEDGIDGIEYKVLGEGAYGCVIRPALPCYGEPDYAPDYSTVSKAFTRSEASNTEFYDGALTRRFDPDAVHTILPTQMCNVPPTYAMEAVLNQCNGDFDFDRPGGVRQLRMPFGGVSLHSLIHDTVALKRYDPALVRVLLTKVADLARWLNVLHLNDTAHFDIKTDNILYDGAALRLIDFGHLDLEEVTREPSMARYFAYPPDYEIIRLVRAGLKDHLGSSAYVDELLARLEFLEGLRASALLMIEKVRMYHAGVLAELGKNVPGGVMWSADYATRSARDYATAISTFRIKDTAEWIRARRGSVRDTADTYGLGLVVLEILQLGGPRLDDWMGGMAARALGTLLKEVLRPSTAAAHRMPALEFGTKLAGAVAQWKEDE